MEGYGGTTMESFENVLNPLLTEDNGESFACQTFSIEMFSAPSFGALFDLDYGSSSSFKGGEMNPPSFLFEEERGTVESSALISSCDRSKTLSSERRRRGTLNERLYALRTLVPNITKMDKASIVGDAVIYVEKLQREARELRKEIAILESTMQREGGGQASYNKNTSSSYTIKHHPKAQSLCRKILQMDVFQVDENGFYVTMICEKSEGVLAATWETLESLSCFYLLSSNFATPSPERTLITFTLQIVEWQKKISVPAVEQQLTHALSMHGFQF
ncbi:transcription factor FER-LIKE IRON DEFICIENCY-INDUCED TRANSCRIPTION FACTOR [Amborella trichopoda]|uniref:transcription factor FER-LIKE IRON DEFICIENCY-INDUCED TRANSCRIPTION FACTOR n=1 Tax=Amborella trichopoda TaxID=13333 RepID=UPI0005D2FC81|nr:transcription factor FER-LIKE IRON DEFICIENCY-INDUCED TRANSCRIPTION FACTOR [Amborella trichopoda]|eukprot:XP_011621304.1 transcription factor FER-LIKE IRON DEFICIENCY-INDUCED TRANSCRIPTION FACTOR [Amborella trichopoda]